MRRYPRLQFLFIEGFGNIIDPASLDSALQLGGVLAHASNMGEARVPFALDDALLQISACRQFRAVNLQQMPESMHVLLGAQGETQASELDGLKLKRFEQQAVETQMKDMFVTDW